MLFIKHTALLIITILLQHVAAAQLPDYYVKMLTEQQGLNSVDFVSIAKDNNNFLWLASQNNVQRYDGKQSWTFPINEGAEQLFIDKQYRIWLITRSGVQLFINDYTGFKPLAHAPDNGQNAISLFYSGNQLCLLLADGIEYFDEQLQQFKKMIQPVIRTSKRITTAANAHPYYLFFATADSIYSFDRMTKRLLSFPMKRTVSIVPLSENSVLASVSGVRTFYVNFLTNHAKELTASEVNPSGKNKFLQIFSGVEMKRDLFLLSSNHGLLEFDYCTSVFRKPAVYYRGDLLNNTLSVRRLFKDANGTVYMTHADGIAWCNPSVNGINYLRYYQYNNSSVPDIDIRSFAMDENGLLWIATLNGLAQLNMQTGSIKSFFAGNDANSINYPSLRHLLYYKKLLWIATAGKGVWLLNTTTNQFKRPLFSKDSIGKKTEESFLSEFIWKMVVLQNGDVFLAGGTNCYIISGTNMLVTKLDKKTFAGVSRSAVQDSSGRIWHGTANGLNCTTDGFRLLFRLQDSFPDKRIAAFCEWQKNHMLIGTKGLYELISSSNKIHTLKQITAIPANRFIYCMEKDLWGKIWLGTDEGLYVYNPKTRIAEHYDAADNVQPQAFNTNGLYMAPSGLMFAGGRTGMNYFDPLRLQKQEKMIYPVATSFSINDDDSSFFLKQQPLTISYFKRNISINISAPGYEKPFRLQYRYRLKSDSNEWMYNGNSRFVRLNNLSAGSYVFTASVSYDGLRWFDSKIPVAFIILKPWWMQWWFRLVCTLLALFMFGQVYVYFRRKRIATEHKQAIAYFANSVYEQSNTDDILWDIARNCISRLGFEDCVIYLADEQRNVLVQKAAYGAKSPKYSEILNPIEIPMGKGIVGDVALTGKAEIINDTTKDKRYIIDDEARLSEMTVPILHQGKVIGIIDSESSRKFFYTRKQLDTLQSIAAICSAKISRSMVAEEMRRAEKELNRLNTKMLETKFLNLRLQMNPHFLFNSLSSIQHLIVSQQTNEAYSYLSVFSNFLRSILQYADKTIITLEEELKMLRMYIKLESLGFDQSFSYEITVDEKLETEDVFIPPLIIQPLIENAIWHGLLHKDGTKHFTVSFMNEDDERMICTVEDNGVGRNAAATIIRKNISKQSHQSKATALIHERLQLLQQKTGKEACMIFEDRQNSETGTRVKVIIPFYNNDDV